MPVDFPILDSLNWPDVIVRRSAVTLRALSEELWSISEQISVSKETLADSRELLDRLESELDQGRRNGNLR
jgi:hypothetical protein